jgi:hypothetical protein
MRPDLGAANKRVVKDMWSIQARLKLSGWLVGSRMSDWRFLLSGLGTVETL